MPGSRLTTGSEGRAALSTVVRPAPPSTTRGSLMCSGSEHHLAADADHVAVDGRRARAGVPGDRLRDVDREAALAHRVQPATDLAGGEGHRGGHLGLDESWRDRVDGEAVLELVLERVDEADDTGLGGGVVGLADVAGDTRDRGDPDDPAVLVDRL